MSLWCCIGNNCVKELIWSNYCIVFRYSTATNFDINTNHWAKSDEQIRTCDYVCGLNCEQHTKDVFLWDEMVCIHK